MTITVPHAASQAFAGDITIATSAGNMIFVVLSAVAPAGANQSAVSVSDSAGNTYAQVGTTVATPSGFGRLFLYKTTAASPSAVTKVTIASVDFNQGIGGQVYEIAGADNTAAVDVSHTGSGTSTAGSSGSSGAPTGTADIAIGACMNIAAFNSPTQSGTTFTSGAGTGDSVDVSGASFSEAFCYSRYLVLSGATAQTFSSTIGSSAAWAALVALFKSGSAAGPVNVKTVAGLAKASVKTVGGLAIASLKTIEGLG